MRFDALLRGMVLRCLFDLLLLPRSLSDSDLSTAANNAPASAFFAAPNNPHRIPANTPPVVQGLRQRICLPFLRLVTNSHIGQASND